MTTEIELKVGMRVEITSHPQKHWGGSTGTIKAIDDDCFMTVLVDIDNSVRDIWVLPAEVKVIHEG